MTASEKKKEKNSLHDKVTIYAAIALIAFLGGKGIKSYISKRNRGNEVNKLDDVSEKAVTFATNLYSAFFQAGQEWYSDWLGDGTDEELCYSVAKQMYQTKTTFAQVSNSYKTLYKRDLLQDLQKELDAKEYQKFNNLFKFGIG